jgi:dihydrofolate reductase
MTRFRFHTATTLDGFLADEHDSLDWLLSQPLDDEPGAPGRHEDLMADVGALAMGATTYAWLVDHLRTTGDPWPYAQPSFVFTHRTFEPLGDVTFVSGPPTEHRAALERAAGGRDVWVVGGGGLASDFAAAGMLDEVLVSIAPVTLGAGRPLFPRAFDLRLRELGRNGAFAVATYDVVGPR